MKEKDKLTISLEKAGKKKSHLAKVMGLSSTSIARYRDDIMNGSIKDSVWLKVADGLRRLGVDPAEIRPTPTIGTSSDLPTDLLPLLDLFQDRQQLEAIGKILAGDERQRAVVRLVISERTR